MNELPENPSPSQLEGMVQLQVLQKTSDINGQISSYVRKALKSGAIDLETMHQAGKYKAFNLILSAVFSQMADDYKPPHPSKDDIADIKNIKLFL